MIRVLVNMPVDPEHSKPLYQIPNVDVHVVSYQEEAYTLPAETLRNAHILFCAHPPDNIRECVSLQLVQISSVGYSQLFHLGLTERRVRACNAQGVFDVPIAEWNVAMMVQLARDMKGMFRNQEHRVWDRSARFQTEIRGSRVGIWGYGGIGRETARLLKAMGMHVQVLVRDGVRQRDNIYRVPGTGDPRGVLPDKVFTAGQELEFVQDLDFLIVAMPLTKSTEGIVGERELRALPASAFLLNPARGPIIAESALLQALREHWIAGAALDTHYYYPLPGDHPLWSLPNVILTPHISGSSLSPHFLPRIWDIFVENVRRYAERRPLLNELSRRQLEGY